MSTEKQNEVEDLKVTEAADGSATVDLPNDFVEEDGDDDQQHAAGGQADAQDDDDSHDDANSGDDDELTEARRNKRRAKRELAKRAKEEKDQLIIALRRENTAMMERVANLERKQGSADLARLNKAIEDEQLRLEYAKSKMAEATNNADGETFAKAQEMWYETRQKLESMQRMKQASGKAAVKTEAAVNPKLIRNANKWMSDNDWYDPNGGDEDSQIAKIVDQRLVSEGWNPEDQEYWDEFDRRLSKRLPHRYTDDTFETTNQSRKRRSVVTGSGRESAAGSGGSGRGTFVLDPEKVRAMKDAGLWDDPEKRRRMIKRYAEQARSQYNRS